METEQKCKKKKREVKRKGREKMRTNEARDHKVYHKVYRFTASGKKGLQIRARRGSCLGVGMGQILGREGCHFLDDHRGTFPHRNKQENPAKAPPSIIFSYMHARTGRSLVQKMFLAKKRPEPNHYHRNPLPLTGGNKSLASSFRDLALPS